MTWESEQFDEIKEILLGIGRKVDIISKRETFILNKEVAIMALADDLNNGMTSLATGFAALDTSVAAELVAIAAALAATPPTPALVTAATQAVANISAITGKMATDAAALTASIPAATTGPPPGV